MARPRSNDKQVKIQLYLPGSIAKAWPVERIKALILKEHELCDTKTIDSVITPENVAQCDETYGPPTGHWFDVASTQAN